MEVICGGSSNKPDVVASWSKKGSEDSTKHASSVTYKFELIHRNDSGVYTCKVDSQGVGESREKDSMIDVICELSLFIFNKCLYLNFKWENTIECKRQR